MDKQITIRMIAILIISLASGFILSFIVYQPQIQALKNDVTTLQEEINSQLAENEETLSDLNETIAELNAKIENLTATSGTTSRSWRRSVIG